MGLHDGINPLWICMMGLVSFMDVLVLVPGCTNIANYLPYEGGFMQEALFGSDLNMGIYI
jgi:hypothetical protein